MAVHYAAYAVSHVTPLTNEIIRPGPLNPVQLCGVRRQRERRRNDSHVLYFNYFTGPAEVMPIFFHF